ncbi:MAG: M36 family metallopeptidase, partial [Pseudobdellovibrionaceae bacterium]
YILGGIKGDTDSVDTDHFDNSVIIHEYGHFLENRLSETDSPGGSHNGNFVVDPRLAWGEGWANFFASAVQGNQYYRDTLGNSDGGSYLLISFNLSATGTNRSGQDLPTIAGEGNFREISVSRSLWQIFYSTFSNISFAFLWETFTGVTNGFKEADLHFRSSGKFWTFLKANVPSSYLTSVDSVLSAEFQDAETQDYARILLPGSCSQISLSPALDSYYEITERRQNLKRSNDFYQYYHSGGTLNLLLTYSQTGTPITDLDLYVYKEGYTYDGATSDELVTSNVSTYPEASGTGRETISNSLVSGTYIINVRAKTNSWDSQMDVGATVNYQLESNGVQLCPQ